MMIMTAVTVEPGQGEAVWFLTNRITVKATSAMTNGAYGLFEAQMPAGFSPPLHVHHGEDEAFWVLDGNFTFRCGDQTVRVGPGGFVFAPRDIPHTFLCEGPGPGRVLTLVSPGGAEAFFVEAGRPAERDGLPPAAPPDIARLKQVSPKYNMEIIGPPLSR
jgi:mannose-6-phosphate isomerase-like protein (cupin superfamily)